VAAAVFAWRLQGQQIDTARAFSGLREALAACRADAGTLWNHDLCGPIALVDRQTRLAILSDSVAQRHYFALSDAFVSVLPETQFVANTSFSWGGREWTMVSLPLPADRYSRIALLLHEVFHREQKGLGLYALDALNNHLDFHDGRVWLRLEYRALAAALRTRDDTESRQHAADALLFRAMRRSLYGTADSTETLLELQEGLPEYTGQRLAMRLTGAGPERVAEYVQSFELRTPTFVRAFAYGTGPALGMLLDRFAPRWREDIRARRDVSGLLIQALAFAAPRDLRGEARRRAELYGFAEVERGERARDSARAPTLNDYRVRFLSEPTIVLRQAKDSLSWSYDPTALVAMDERTLIYPSGSFSAPWGRLQVDSNAVLVANDFSFVRVSAGLSAVTPGKTGTLRGDGWTLQLNAGWRIEADPGRPGSFVATRMSLPSSPLSP
jgi:hypothetical protein